MLKEVIAEHIVEKARRLSQYDVPDEAFQANNFRYGDKNGAYSKYFPCWYSFLDDQIGDHGVFVVSCNNSAVENITKELPLSSGISNQLKVQTSGNQPDSEEMKEQLNEIASLFSASSSPKKFNLYTNDVKLNDEYPEIFFTGYARKLLGSNGRDADAWGLIAAPLGKKSNISNFYYDVLNPLWKDFLMSTQDIEARAECYKTARDRFIEQLEKVETMQSDLSAYSNIAQQAHTASLKYKILEKRSERETADASNELSAIAERKIGIKQQISADRAEYDIASAAAAACSERVRNLQEPLKAVTDRISEYERKASEAEKSVSFFSRVFKTNKYREAVKLSESYKNKSKEYSALSAQQLDVLHLAESDLRNAEKIKKTAAENLADSVNVLENLQNREKQLHEAMCRLQNEKETAEIEAEEHKKECGILLKKLTNGTDTERGIPIDDKLISDILSEDELCSSQSQLVNPWVTQHYNREREKLFYFALQMTKEFLLSSKCCRDNLCILGQYWGLRTENDAGRIKFHEKDRQAMVGSLFQTLFLLTPVLSSTFASVGRLLKDMTEPGSIGTLLIDEAGQAQPQMAVGAIYRARHVLIVGDPKQVEPVVTDDLKLLKEAYSEPVFGNYKDKGLSVQSCADIINPFGTFFENGTDRPDWVGCPLLVHRRCISPMYDISNQISYNGIMKQQTLMPSEKKESLFLLKASQWINIAGDEAGYKNHYVPAQGKRVCELVETAFEHSDFPDLFIISPFNKVVVDIRKELLKYAGDNQESFMAEKHKHLNRWLNSNIGTVHKFQGKEADEVIFLLGCDMKQKDSYAVKGFVNSNIVNVAVTRAKYRLYIIGDSRVWQQNQYIREAKAIMDVLPIKTIAKIKEQNIPDNEKQKMMIRQAAQLPGASSFTVETESKEDGEIELQIDSDEFVANLDCAGFLNQELSEMQIKKFGFASKEEFSALPSEIKKNLLMAFKLYFLLKPIYQSSGDLDASCCGILFCKATELRIRENFMDGLKEFFPDCTIYGGRLKIKEAKDTDFMIGTISNILNKYVIVLAKHMQQNGDAAFTEEWWRAFVQNNCEWQHWFLLSLKQFSLMI